MRIVSRQRREQIRNSQKHKARALAKYALKTGKILRQSCFCGEPAEMHHSDYSKPLDVIWLCAFHHRDRHNRSRRLLKFEECVRQRMLAIMEGRSYFTPKGVNLPDYYPGGN